MNDPLDFSGKVVLVTGSSRGIGAEMIKAFGSRGANCVVNYISDSAGQNKTDAQAVAKELKDPLMIDCDVTNPQQVEAMMKQIAERFGGLDILVNNSGIIRDRTIKKLTLEEFESIIRVNLTGTFNVTQKAAAILRNDGRIVNMSSVSGQMGLFGQANYSSSKAAIIALTKVSAREFARQNITVNAIAPGFIDVGMSKGMPDEVTENFKKQIPLGRLGDVNEIVERRVISRIADGELHHRSRLERERRVLHGIGCGTFPQRNRYSWCDNVTDECVFATRLFRRFSKEAMRQLRFATRSISRSTQRSGAIIATGWPSIITCRASRAQRPRW